MAPDASEELAIYAQQQIENAPADYSQLDMTLPSLAGGETNDPLAGLRLAAGGPIGSDTPLFSPPANTALPPADRVNWSFIRGTETQSLNGYVPMGINRQTGEYGPIDSSGVTIATGLDLGGQTLSGLEQMGIPQDLIEQFTPYVGLTGWDAFHATQGYSPLGPSSTPGVDFAGANPLTITQPQADLVDSDVQNYFFDSLSRAYNRAGPPTQFAQLPADAQTSLMDMWWQTGTVGRMNLVIPGVWSLTTEGNWQAAADALSNWSGAYQQRRWDQGAMLNNGIQAGALPAAPPPPVPIPKPLPPNVPPPPIPIPRPNY